MLCKLYCILIALVILPHAKKACFFSFSDHVWKIGPWAYIQGAYNWNDVFALNFWGLYPGDIFGGRDVL